MPPAPILSLTDVTLALGGAPMLDRASIAVARGERLCLVGRNGSGKSTLLRIAAGSLAPDDGVRFVQPGCRIASLPQEPDLAGYATAYDYARAELASDDPGYRARAMLDALALDGGREAAQLSGGEARRAALARALAADPDLLLLDEPTNHLDMPTIAWLEAELGSLTAAIIMISHDRRMLETLARGVVWLDRGHTRRLDQGFGQFEAWRDEQLRQDEASRHKLDRQIAREEDWMRYGVTARRKRNVRRVDELAALRARRRETILAPAGLALEARAAEFAGRLVSVAEAVGKSYGERTIVRGLELRVLRGDRLGIVGGNGAGKTTLLRLLTGLEAPDEGRVTLARSLVTVTLDQQRRSLRPDRTLAETLTGGSGDMVQVAEGHQHVIGYMKQFLFRPEQARTPVGTLSGGERGRLALAVALARPCDLLVLDEPTNDLDLETLDLLQEMLSTHPGTVLLVSHDRDFLDRVATSVLAAEGDGRWCEYAGGFSDMLSQGGRLAGAPAVRAPERRKAASPAAEPSGPTRARLSYKHRLALQQLPDEISRCEAEIGRLRGLLEDPGLYHRDPQDFARLTALLAEQVAALAQAEERWLELEIMREELEDR